MSSAIPVPLRVFSSWAKSSEIENVEFVSIERWKFLSRRAFWHEFIVVQLKPSSVEISPPPNAIKGLAAFRDLNRTGLVIRFDRRVRDDFACFVFPQDKEQIRLDCHLISIISQRDIKLPKDDAQGEIMFRRPCLRDVVFCLEMITDSVPSYNLFSRNCWTFAASIELVLSTVLHGDLVLDPVDGIRRHSVTGRSLGQKMKALLGDLFGKSRAGSQALLISVLAVTYSAVQDDQKEIEKLMDETRGTKYERHVRREAAKVEKLRGATAGDQLEIYNRMSSRLSREGGINSATELPIELHPFRGYIRTIQLCDVLIGLEASSVNVSELGQLGLAFLAIMMKPEWRYLILRPGPHLRMAKYIQIMFRTGYHHKLEGLVTGVLHPMQAYFDFGVEGRNSESRDPETLQPRLLYECYLEPTDILSDMIHAVMVPLTHFPQRRGITLLRSLVDIFGGLASDRDLLVLMIGKGLFKSFMNIIMERLDSIDSECLETMLNFFGEGIQHLDMDPKVLFALSLALSIHTQLSVSVRSAAVRLSAIMMTITEIHETSTVAVLSLTVLLHSCYMQPSIIRRVIAALCLCMRAESGEGGNDNGFDEQRCGIFVAHQGLKLLFQFLQPSYLEDAYPRLSEGVLLLLVGVAGCGQSFRPAIFEEIFQGDNMRSLTRLMHLEPSLGGFANNMPVYLLWHLSSMPGFADLLADKGDVDKIASLLQNPPTMSIQATEIVATLLHEERPLWKMAF